jgi:DNA-binding HxlR family transcriptional regulator
MRVRCPRCGFTFEVDMSKGKGAHYAAEIQRLSELHLLILEILKTHGPCTKKRLGALLAEQGRRVSGNSLSGRLSELLGLGLVEVTRTQVREYDPAEKRYRFVKKPVWSITKRGEQVLLRGGALA